ncbi:MAG: hypothetical protein ACI4PF_01065 [Christensenellales bacterium]
MQLLRPFTKQEFVSFIEYCNANNKTYKDMGNRLETCDWEKNRKNEIEDNIAQLKSELTKWKEDVEQVELFGMERADYEQKKIRCSQIITELRILEEELKNL